MEDKQKQVEDMITRTEVLDKIFITNLENYLESVESDYVFDNDSYLLPYKDETLEIHITNKFDLQISLNTEHGYEPLIITDFIFDIITTIKALLSSRNFVLINHIYNLKEDSND